MENWPFVEIKLYCQPEKQINLDDQSRIEEILRNDEFVDFYNSQWNTYDNIGYLDITFQMRYIGYTGEILAQMLINLLSLYFSCSVKLDQILWPLDDKE